MIEIHALPTAIEYQNFGVYTRFVTGQRTTSVTITPVVMFDKAGILSTGKLHISRMIQISTTSLATKPGLTDQITIDGKDYQFINPILVKNPGFVPYWESEIAEKIKSRTVSNPTL